MENNNSKESNLYDKFKVDYVVSIRSNGTKEKLKESAIFACDNINKVSNFMRKMLGDDLIKFHINRVSEKSYYKGVLRDTSGKIPFYSGNEFEHYCR